MPQLSDEDLSAIMSCHQALKDAANDVLIFKDPGVALHLCTQTTKTERA
jgi:hypothetical protein